MAILGPKMTILGGRGRGLGAGFLTVIRVSCYFFRSLLLLPFRSMARNGILRRFSLERPPQEPIFLVGHMSTYFWPLEGDLPCGT